MVTPGRREGTTRVEDKESKEFGLMVVRDNSRAYNLTSMNAKERAYVDEDVMEDEPRASMRQLGPKPEFKVKMMIDDNRKFLSMIGRTNG